MVPEPLQNDLFLYLEYRGKGHPLAMFTIFIVFTVHIDNIVNIVALRYKRATVLSLSKILCGWCDFTALVFVPIA